MEVTSLQFELVKKYSVQRRSQRVKQHLAAGVLINLGEISVWKEKERLDFSYSESIDRTHC